MIAVLMKRRLSAWSLRRIGCLETPATLELILVKAEMILFGLVAA